MTEEVKKIKNQGWKTAVLITWKVLKFVVFISFVYTGIVLYKTGNSTNALLLVFAAALYIIFNKIDNQDKRIIDIESEIILRRL